MKKVKLTFWLIGFGCGIVVTGMIGALLCLNVKVEPKDQVYAINDSISNQLEEEKALMIQESQIETQKHSNEVNAKSESQTVAETKFTQQDSDQKNNQDFGTVIEEEKFCEVVIPSNLSASEICKLLEEKGIVEDGKAFLAYIKERKKQTYLKSGHYNLQINVSYEELLSELIS